VWAGSSSHQRAEKARSGSAFGKTDTRAFLLESPRVPSQNAGSRLREVLGPAVRMFIARVLILLKY
jgi:hypothetical protein